MTTRRRLGDRRSRVRYEIVGQLWGSLETFEPMDIHNLSRGGALVETRVSLTTDSVHRLRFAAPDQTLDLQARVAHISPRQDVTAADNYLVGVQFLALPPQAGDYIETVVTRNLEQGDAPAAPVGEA